MDRDRGEPSEPSSDAPADERTPGGQKPEDVEDRPLVSKVTAEDYPKEDRATGRKI